VVEEVTVRVVTPFCRLNVPGTVKGETLCANIAVVLLTPQGGLKLVATTKPEVLTSRKLTEEMVHGVGCEIETKVVKVVSVMMRLGEDTVQLNAGIPTAEGSV
jgi:hypothetical protein